MLLGVRYQEGQGGVTQDLVKAFHLFSLAANAGHATAQFNLGVCYDEGAGVKEDKSMATFWYRKAAAQGFSAAFVMLEDV